MGFSCVGRLGTFIQFNLWLSISDRFQSVFRAKSEVGFIDWAIIELTHFGGYMKLNQLIAVLQSVKANANKGKTEVSQLSQKSTLFQGLSRTYQPREEDGFVYPPESQKLTLKADDLIEKFVQFCSEFLDLAATQDYANTEAKASVTVDGQTIIADVPVSYLCYFSKSSFRI
jgi:hypothetical protein